VGFEERLWEVVLTMKKQKDEKMRETLQPKKVRRKETNKDK